MEQSNNKNIDRIIRYFDGELSATERAAFEIALKNDVELYNEAKFYRDMIQVVQEEGAAQTEDWLTKVDVDNVNTAIRQRLILQDRQLSNNKKQANSKKATIRALQPLRRFLSIAASILLLVVAGIFFYANQNYSDTALANRQYLGADTSGTLSGNTAENMDFQRAITDFKNQTNLNNVKVMLQKISLGDENYIEAQYFLGHIFYQQKNYIQAIEKYELVLNSANRPAYINADKLRWNLLLARLVKGENIEVEIDNLIKNGSPTLQQKAKDLQKQQRSFWRRLTI